MPGISLIAPSGLGHPHYIVHSRRENLLLGVTVRVLNHPLTLASGRWERATANICCDLFLTAPMHERSTWALAGSALSPLTPTSGYRKTALWPEAEIQPHLQSALPLSPVLENADSMSADASGFPHHHDWKKS